MKTQPNASIKSKLMLKEEEILYSIPLHVEIVTLCDYILQS